MSGLSDLNAAFADLLLPAGVNDGLPVRLACDDDQLAVAAAHAGTDDPVTVLHAAGLVTASDGVGPLARSRMIAGDPPGFLAGLAVLVCAASRMTGEDDRSMHDFYGRLAGLLRIPARDSWPPVPGVPELTGRFTDLAAWMAGPQAGRRGLLDLDPPGDRYVDVPIGQTLLRAGDRRHLGRFFHRHRRQLDAGWDPVGLLRRWSGRHQLSAPTLRTLDRDDLAPALASAVRAARLTWDGSLPGSDGRAVLPGELALHVGPGRAILGLTCPALDEPADAHGPDGSPLTLSAHAPAEVLHDWLILAADGPVCADLADGRRVRLLPGPTVLFEIGPLGLTETQGAEEDPVWVLTCDTALIARTDRDRRHRCRLPDGWQLLVDIDSALLGDEQRDPGEAPAVDPVRLIGGLPLGRGVWLLDHPPAVEAVMDESVSVFADGRLVGDADFDRPCPLDAISHQPGAHRVITDAGPEFDVELVEHGPQQHTGRFGFDLRPGHAHAGPGALPVDEGAVTLTGALPSSPDPAWRAPLIVRYRASVDVIDIDGAVRALAPPAVAPWLQQLGLDPGAWEIPDPDTAVWVCVDAAARPFVIARQDVDVPITDAVLDVVDLHHASPIVDRTPSTSGEARWQRLLTALDTAEGSGGDV